jgi:tripeptide aminopeptidase
MMKRRPEGSDMIAPKQTLEELAAVGTACLEEVIAIDSQSDESSPTIPSSEGQRRLSDHLRRHFEALGYESEQDESANLLVRIPGNAEGDAMALMVHMDTSRGTQAVPRLECVPGWDGGLVRYPRNERLHVSVQDYPALRMFVGDDLIHGPGEFPVGFDDKVGMSELMLLARILRDNSELPHPELWLVFRPDEEIGRMEAVEGLARNLQGKGVRFGYTIDGLLPFEVNVENFYASRAEVRIAGEPLQAGARRFVVLVKGVNTHGATAKDEGYLNATVIFARAFARVADRGDVVALDFATDELLEGDARIEFAATEEGEAALAAALDTELASARRRGATWSIVERKQGGDADDAAMRLHAHLRRFLESPGPRPLLAEDSEGFEGYSAPHHVHREGGELVLLYRLRDFDAAELRQREAHVASVADAAGLKAQITQQYVNMGPELAKHPALVRMAEEALRAISIEPKVLLIRGGTGVAPFLERAIPVANLGTGYFAPESEKELTSRQNLARHGLWLAQLVQQAVRS